MQGLPCKCAVTLRTSSVRLICVWVSDCCNYQVYQTQSDDRLKVKRRHCMRGERGERRERGERNRVEDRKDWARRPTSAGPSGSLLAGQQLQNNATPWITTSGSQKWRRRRGYRWGWQLWWRLATRRPCRGLDNRWRVPRQQMTEKEEDLTKNGSRHCRSFHQDMTERQEPLSPCVQGSAVFKICEDPKEWWQATSWSSRSIDELFV